MKKNATYFRVMVIFIMILNTSCNQTKEQYINENVTMDQTQNQPSSTQNPITITISPIMPNEENTIEKATEIISFSSMEEAYYSKYNELAEKYDTQSLYDYKDDDAYSECSFLNGVCVVNLMDFDGDGKDDLFVVYSNMQNIVLNEDDFEMNDFPTQNTYELEIWSYKDSNLTQLLHEPCVSLSHEYPNEMWSDYYKVFVNVYANNDGYPVIQLYSEKDKERHYKNIYCSNGQIVRDEFVYSDGLLKMNNMEVAEEIWSENIAGYKKILMCVLLADSANSSTSLFEGCSIDYNNTLSQTERVISYLSQDGRNSIVSRYNIAEAEYISLYMQEIERSNRIKLNEDFTENHEYNLYDIDQNGIPELILYEGSSGAGTHYHFYTIINGELIYCGDYGRTVLFVNDEGGLIAYHGRMDYYVIDKIALNVNTIQIQGIAEGTTRESDGEPSDYPYLDEFGYENYRYFTFCPPTVPMASYTYGYELPID